MATRNRAGRTLATVERLLALPDGWPVIVVDNASSDGTSERLRSRFGEQITVITLDRNRGAAARNVGAAATGAHLVAFADDDSWWAPGALARAGHAFEEYPDVGLIAATVVVEPEQEVDPIVTLFDTSPLPSAPPGRSVLGFVACGAVLRRRAFLEAGGFEELLGVGGEEELLALDLRSHRWRLVHLPEVVAHHEPSRADGGREGRAARMTSNRLLVTWMRRPLREALRASVIVLRSAGTDPVARAAAVRTVRSLPIALRRRRPLPRSVEFEDRLLRDTARP